MCNVVGSRERRERRVAFYIVKRAERKLKEERESAERREKRPIPRSLAVPTAYRNIYLNNNVYDNMSNYTEPHDETHQDRCSHAHSREPPARTQTHSTQNTTCYNVLLVRIYVCEVRHLRTWENFSYVRESERDRDSPSGHTRAHRHANSFTGACERGSVRACVLHRLALFCLCPFKPAILTSLHYITICDRGYIYWPLKDQLLASML